MKPIVALFGALLWAVAMVSYAQNLPDAGVLQRQTDQPRTHTLPDPAPAEPLTPTNSVVPDQANLVTVTQFRFTGNSLLSADQLAATVDAYLNRPIGFNQLQAAAAAVAQSYRDAGWFVRVYLPQQEVSRGVVTIRIIEAVFGTLQHEGVVAPRGTWKQVNDIFAAHQKPGDFVNANALDRALLLANDLPGIKVAGSFTSGASEGATDLILSGSNEPLLVGEITRDNTGARSTGVQRLSGSLDVRSPTGTGDLLSARVISSRGSDYFRLAYSLPIGSRGWRAGINTSRLSYRLTSPEFAALEAAGSSDNVGIEASYPIVRTRTKNLYLELRYNDADFDNQTLGFQISHYRVRAAELGVNANRFDQWMGGGFTNTSLFWKNGRVDDRLTRNYQHFNKFSLDLSRQQVLSPSVSFHAALKSQVSRDALDSSERFYLGGAQGVRAYPSNEGGGDRGAIANLELQWRINRQTTLAAFYDYGQISNVGNSGYSLKGAGLWASWQSDMGANLKATWARRLGENPNPTATGLDQDGSLIQDRWWLLASLPF